MTTVPLPPLVDALTTIPDVRRAKGRRHPLSAILALACVAMLCNNNSLLAIAEWGRRQDPAVVARLGLTQARTPCVATLHRVFKTLDVAAFERIVGTWAAQVTATLGQDAALPGLAIDGKTLRGSAGLGVPAAHLLSALGHDLGLVLAQAPVGAKTNEIGGLPDLLATLVLDGWVVTLDALHTQRETAETILAKGGPT